jgi:tetraacyldisaccharide-1-P 4'-kinase
MFSKGNWVHKNSMDIFYEALKVYNVHKDYVKVKYNSWNINEFGQPFIVPGGPYRSKVMKKDKTNWRQYVDTDPRI